MRFTEYSEVSHGLERFEPVSQVFRRQGARTTVEYLTPAPISGLPQNIRTTGTPFARLGKPPVCMRFPRADGRLPKAGKPGEWHAVGRAPRRDPSTRRH